MKTAISIPDDVFRRAERLAQSTGVSRSQLVSDAIREYVARHAPEEVTEAFDRLAADIEPESDFALAGTRRMLKRVEW